MIKTRFPSDLGILFTVKKNVLNVFGLIADQAILIIFVFPSFGGAQDATTDPTSVNICSFDSDFKSRFYHVFLNQAIDKVLGRINLMVISIISIL